MKKLFFLLILFALISSCSDDIHDLEQNNVEKFSIEDVFIEVDNSAFISHSFKTNAKSYIPPFIPSQTFNVVFNGCYTYTLPVDLYQYNNEVLIDPGIIPTSGTLKVFVKTSIYSPYTYTFNITASTPHAFVGQNILNGSTQFVWWMQSTSGNSYNCWPNPTAPLTYNL
jgi:hypothetical protein